MANMKAIKRRIKSVSGTKQITKAMQLVASSKLRHAKTRAEVGRSFFERQYEILFEIAAENDELSTPFTTPRVVKNTLHIVIAGDRGLAGGYNSNVLKLSVEGTDPAHTKILAIGRKAVEYFEKRTFDICGKYPLFAENAKSADCADIANIVCNLYLQGQVDEVKIYYTAFVSSLTQTATELKILPLDAKTDKKPVDEIRATTYDPSPVAVFNRIIPKFTASLIQCAVVESFASEQAARRIAMENATDNADQMITDLSLKYNRARQEKITNEINEIVSGANALS